MLARIIYETASVFIVLGGINLTCLQPPWKYFPPNHSVVCDYLTPKADSARSAGIGLATSCQA